MDGTEDQVENSAAPAPAGARPVAAAQPQRQPSRLTFHPSRDDPARLRSFLDSVSREYARRTRPQTYRQVDPFSGLGSVTQNQQIHQVAGPLRHSFLPVANALNPAMALPIDQNVNRKRSASDLHAAHAAPSPPPQPLLPAVAAARLPEASNGSPTSDGMPPPARRGRRRRSSNHASLLRAKTIDFHKPDPEEESPPNETEDERRRRRERINGRRKRAKKMIEIDFLNEQYHILRDENTRLKNENDSFRERIAMLKQFSAGAPSASEEQNQQEPLTSKLPAYSFESSEQVDSAQQRRTPEHKAEIDPNLRQGLPSLLQFALAPSAFTLRPVGGERAGTNYSASPSEETKDSFVQPQFVSQERVGTNPFRAGTSLLGASLPGLSAPSQRERVSGSYGSQQISGSSPLPPSSSIISALFDHRHQTAPLTESPSEYSLLTSPSSQRQLYQSLLQGRMNQGNELHYLQRHLQQQNLQQQQSQARQQQQSQARQDNQNKKENTDEEKNTRNPRV